MQIASSIGLDWLGAWLRSVLSGTDDNTAKMTCAVALDSHVTRFVVQNETYIGHYINDSFYGIALGVVKQLLEKQLDLLLADTCGNKYVFSLSDTDGNFLVGSSDGTLATYKSTLAIKANQTCPKYEEGSL